MGKSDLKISFHPNTSAEHENILQKLRSRSKIDNKSALEWKKVFTKLNSLAENEKSKDLKAIRQSSNTVGQNNSVNKPIYGPIPGFPSGSWWGIRMDCSRDQVHTPFDSDIEEGDFGVTSICTSNINTTNDIDLGTLLTYTGGEYQPKTSRKLNDPLLDNFKSHIPLRLVRSYNLANEFAPKTGYRYDGLYIVVSFWIGVCSNSKRYYKYALARLNHQEPPVWSMPTRTSTRLSSSMQKTNSKSSCGSLKCHMDCCQVQKSEGTLKKINLEKSSNVNMIKLIHNNVNSSSAVSQKDNKESTIVMRHVSKKYESASPIQPLNTTYSSMPPSCDFQNMNISIRTELYDSTPNPQEDFKKSTPMTFYKVHRGDNKLINKNIIRTNSPDAINLNIFGSTDNLSQESSSTIKSFGKNTLNQNFKAMNHQECLINNGSSNIDKKIKSDISVEKVININSNVKEEISDNINLTNQTNSVSCNFNTNSKNPNVEVNGCNESVNKKSNLPEAFVEIESMTPEQMLNLIVKKRFNPTGKLLMGSIIGLPANDSSLLNFNGPLKKIENKNATKEKNNKYYKSTSKATSAMKVEQKNKNGRSKKNTESLSKSSLIKRRRNELAKLTINANFMTNLRGQSIQTRTMSNRRLRCPKILLNKKKEFPGFVTNFSCVDLTKKNKKSRITKKSHVLTKMRKNLANSKRKEVVKNESKIQQAQNNQIKCNNNNNESRNKNTKKKLNLKQNKLFAARNKVEKAVDVNIEMKDASTQCLSRKDASTLVNMERQLFYERNDLVKVEWIDLVDDMKAELNESNHRSLSTIFYRDKQVQTSQDYSVSNKNELYHSTYISDDSSDVKPNSNDCRSAFVPVNLSDRDVRVVKLRSIGFKPIETCEATNNPCYANYYTNTDVEPAVVTREVNEQYNKYTSEENSTVEYMDNELHYQDIEDEDVDEDDEYEEDEEEEEDDVEIEVEMKDDKELIIPKNTGNEVIYDGYMKKRKRSSSSMEQEEDEEEIEIEENNEDDEENLPWLGWNRLVKTKR
ncbi:putative uncharacterized protein DDB_G0282133 [Chelonus insularis]|uniref:putative uncharacterized protein DDB_G0282133 n=1 Tax=Chelonus insularis TaxID=460826 RepID=UPI00158D7CA0|nr:putative uncharacterized protein DDB_G0282133 [Chelonus insularis]